MKIASCFSIWLRRWPIGSSFFRSAFTSNRNLMGTRQAASTCVCGLFASLDPLELLSFAKLGTASSNCDFLISIFCSSLPLDRAWRLAANVVNHTRHSRHLIYDPRGHPLQRFPRQSHPVCRHRVVRLHHSHSHRQSVGSPVPHHPNASHRQQHRERLPHLFIPSCTADLFRHDRVRFPQGTQILTGNFP